MNRDIEFRMNVEMWPFLLIETNGFSQSARILGDKEKLILIEKNNLYYVNHYFPKILLEKSSY